MNLNKFFTLICAILVIVNVTYFIKGVGLSDEVNYYEKQVTKYKHANIEIEQQIYALESLNKTASLAGELKYGKYNDPLFVDKPQYAYNNP